MHGLWQDVRYALRTMRRAPGFTTVVVLSLALGIGANTAIFSLVDALMLRRLPVADPGTLVELLSRYPDDRDKHGFNGFSTAVYEQFRDQNHVFSALSAMAPARFEASREGGETETLDGAFVDGALFRSLGVRPAIGRLIGPGDDQAGRGAVAVVSWPYWRRVFGLDPAIVGASMTIDGAAATIIGVTSRDFSGLEPGTRPDVWRPLRLRPPQGRRLSDQFGLKLMARLKPGVSLEQARAEMDVLNRQRVEALAQISGNAVWRQATLGVESASTGFSTLRAEFGKPLLTLMALVALLLLTACTNIAGLLLARGAGRQRELAVRMAIGAGRLRLARQMLTESLLLALAGCVPAVGLAYVGAGALVRILSSGLIVGLAGRGSFDVRPDGRLLLFAIAVAAGTGLLFGLAPAWHAWTVAPISSIKDASGAGESRRRRLFADLLVTAQVALSVVLLTAAVLFADHLSTLRNVGLGFVRDSLLLVTLNPQRAGYDNAQLTIRYQELLARLHAIPGVRSATLSATTPAQGAGAASFANVEGTRERPEERRYLSLNRIGPRYFDTLGTPWLAGRDFEFADAARPRVAIVNQALARHYFGNASPLGKHLTLDSDHDGTPYEIVGVAGDARYLNLHQSPPTVYLNAFQEGRIASQFALRTTVPPTSVVNDVRRAIAGVLGPVPIVRVTTMDDQVNASIVPERLIATLSGFFGALGALLAAIGLYGLLAYSVARRTTEIGVRMALGATRGHVIAMVLRSALSIVAGGLAAGTLAAFWSQRIAAGLLEGLAAGRLAPIAAAAVMLAAVAVMAAYLPARRAARVSPMEALRSL